LQADEENEEIAVEGDAEIPAPAPAADHGEPCPDCGLPFKSSGTLAVSFVTVNF
jgi:hypothetical protein